MYCEICVYKCYRTLTCVSVHVVDLLFVYLELLCLCAHLCTKVLCVSINIKYKVFCDRTCVCTDLACVSVHVCIRPHVSVQLCVKENVYTHVQGIHICL